MKGSTKLPAGAPEFLTHLETVDEVLRAHPGMERRGAIDWLMTRLRAGTIYAEWVRDAKLCRLKIEFWLNPLAAALFEKQTVNAAQPFGRNPTFNDLRRDTNIWLTRENLEKCLASEKRSAGGRRPGYDWAVIKAEAFRLMDQHGEFVPENPRWNAQVRLEEALMEFCQEKFNDEPSDSTLRGYIPGWLSEWRQAQDRGNP